ncbi:Polyphosphate:ADP phosphotransferase 1 [Alphaproteobacteria bacterium SO-S41]|nr:Polyphosphate:ADP phosphotransferase 1 [Alphaproteobacteria bacterium SO-S41]
MSKKHESKNEDYENELYDLQVELVKFQRDIIANGEKVLVIMEGRDGAGKDGTIKRIVENLSPRETRVVALPKPSDREASQWYFQRYSFWLPAAGEFVLFNRSWYNRAGVEPVMGFCTPAQTEAFFDDVVEFEHMLVKSGVQLFKYYLDIDRDEQKERLEERLEDPLKQWKISPIDAKAMEKFDDYTKARDTMFKRTDHKHGPWSVVRANNKKQARLNVIRDLLERSEYKGKRSALAKADRAVVIPFTKGLLRSKALAR